MARRAVVADPADAAQRDQLGALLPVPPVGGGPDVQLSGPARIGRIDIIAPVGGLDVGVGPAERKRGGWCRRRSRRSTTQRGAQAAAEASRQLDLSSNTGPHPLARPAGQL